jgi:predicted membrane-bound spermidine synthase
MSVLRWGPRYAGVGLLSVATLMFQISYTRVLSVALWHHFVWMVVSIALLGYAASGTLLTVFPRLLERDIDRILAATSALFSASILLSYWILNRIPFDPARLSWDVLQLLYITIYYLILSIPFLLSGIAIALTIKRAESRINRVYFSNLVGSALGSILVLPSFGLLTGPGVIVLSSTLAGASAVAFAINLKGRVLRFVSAWTIALLLLLPLAGTYLPIRMSPYKSLMVALRYPDARLLETQWNAFSRVDVVDSGFVRHAPGLSLSYEDPIPEQIGVIVDGDVLNAITKYDISPSSLAFTEALPTALPYRLHDNPEVLIIGAGGGLEVLTALHHGSLSVMAVEANPTVVRLVLEDYGAFSGNIYQDERVRAIVSEGRSFIRGSQDVYDIIVLPMAHGASATSSGVYALSEDYLYTVESFRELLGRLSEDGFLCVSTWLLPPPREDVRMVSLAVAALEDLDVIHPSEHIAVIRSYGTITLLVGRSPLGEEEISAIRGFCGEMGFDIVYLPGVEASEVNVYNRFSEPIYYRLVQGMLHAEDREGFYRGYLYDISPTTDERPFFFQFFRWDRLLETYESLDRRWQPLIEGGYLVPLALAQALILSVVLILLPIRKLGKSVEGRLRPLAYFFCLGVGYMLVEMATVQRFILLLGHPTYSISVVIFSLLLSSGLGSYISGRIDPGSMCHKLVLLTIGILAPFYGMASPLFSQLLSLPSALKIIAVFIVLVPLGLLMGMPFPLGVGMMRGSREDLIPWAWATNGCASVLGSILPIIMALSFGFSMVFIAAGVAYMVGLLMILQLESS